MSAPAGTVGLNVVAETTGVQVGMINAATISERELKRIGQYVAAVSQQQKQWTNTVQQAATTSAASYEKVTQAAKKMEGGHSGVNRELLVLAHEMSQGNYTKFGGSLLVLAERADALKYVMSGTGLAIGAVAGVVLGAGAAMAMGAIEADKFSKALQLTGNYAAVTAASIADMAQRQKALTGQSIGGARESIETVAGTGRFGPQALEQVARALGDYQKLTHASAEDALKQFESLSDGAAKWAEKTNASMHYLSLAQYDQIKALEEAGDKQGAAAMAAGLLAQTLESRGTPAVGTFARAWHAVTDAVTGAIEAMKNVGRPVDGITAGLDQVERQIALVKQANTANPAAAADYVAALQNEQTRLRQQAFRNGERATDVSARASVTQQAIEDRSFVEQVLKGAKALSARTDELKKWHDAVANAARAGSPMSAEDIKAGEDSIKKKYTDTSGQKAENTYSHLMETIKAFNATTDQEIERQGKLTEAQQFAIHEHEELAKAKRSLSKAQYEAISTAIDEAAAHRTVAQAALDAAKATIERVRADTANQEAQRAIVSSVVGSSNDQANAYYRQIQLIGKSADEIAKAQALLQFDDVIGKALLGADNDTAARVIEIADVMRTNLVQAIDAAKKAQDDYNASFSNGFADAARDYVKQAANSASWGQKVFTDATGAMTDAIVQFAETGKLSFKGLVRSMIDDIVRMQAQKGFAAIFGSGGGSGIGGLLGGLFGSGGSGASGLGDAGYGDYSSAGLAMAYGYANGLDYVPYDGFPAILHEGEKVMRKQDAALERSSGGGMHFNFSGQTVNVGQGVSRAEVYAAVQQANDKVKADISRQVRTRGGI
jgi:lambda family phage tail tape measure protein